MPGIQRKHTHRAVERPDAELTEAQRLVREKLGAEVQAGDGCRWGEVFMYARGPDGTTRILVAPDGTLLERTAWSRPRR